MKKILFLTISILLIFSLCACNSNNNSTTTNPTNNVEIQNTTIDNLLYEKDMNKIKKIYKEDAIVSGDETNYSITLHKSLYEINGYYKYSNYDGGFNSYFTVTPISYYTEETLKQISNQNDFSNFEKDNMDNVKKEIENIYSSISKNMDIHSYNATGCQMNQEEIEYGDLTNKEEFYSYVSKMFNTDRTSEDQTQISRVTFLGLDTSCEHAIRITFDHTNSELYFTIRELPIEK